MDEFGEELDDDDCEKCCNNCCFLLCACLLIPCCCVNGCGPKQTQQTQQQEVTVIHRHVIQQQPIYTFPQPGNPQSGGLPLQAYPQAGGYEMQGGYPQLGVYQSQQGFPQYSQYPTTGSLPPFGDQSRGGHQQNMESKTGAFSQQGGHQIQGSLQQPEYPTHGVYPGYSLPSDPTLQAFNQST